MDARTRLSRRDFLKLSGTGLLSLFLTAYDLDIDNNPSYPAAPRQGRIAFTQAYIYEAPSFDSRRVGSYRRDELVTIAAEVTGLDERAYNRLWYQIDGEGYLYSGAVQPVSTTFNQPVYELPPSGVTAEVTVPFTETRWRPGLDSPRAYRVYFGSTHWVTATMVNRRDQSVWYRLYDDRLRVSYYASVVDLRIVDPDELTPLSPEVPVDDKLLRVNLQAQQVTAYEYGRLVFTARTATGARRTETPVGRFRTFHKRTSRHMIGDGFDLPGVPWVTYITHSGVAFHGTYWHNDYGRPRSAGCINLTSADAKWVYRWTMPAVPAERRFLYNPGEGTPVLVSGRPTF
jgi:lipoprotein-anchoring transpeptidase ErfK/SrfK